MPVNDDSGRTQPEFSLGERLARVEAAIEGYALVEVELQRQLDRRIESTQELQDEKLKGLRAEHQAALLAGREALLKVESVIDRRFETAGANAEKREELLGARVFGLDTRIQTLERNVASSARVEEHGQQVSAQTVAWIVAIATVAYTFIALFATHVI